MIEIIYKIIETIEPLKEKYSLTEIVEALRIEYQSYKKELENLD